MPTRTAALCLCALVLVTPASLWADAVDRPRDVSGGEGADAADRPRDVSGGEGADVADHPRDVSGGVLPGGPPTRSGAFTIGPETGLVIPLSTNRLCPSEFQCIADVGWAVGLGFAYRWRNGLGLGFGYEFWLLSANGVYEITVPQSFLGSLQATFLPSRAVHPVLRLRGGLLLLGPSFRVETLGGTLEIGGGAEVEIGPDRSFSFLLTGNLLRTGSFETPGDGAVRATSGALDAMLVLRVGFHFFL